MDGVNLAFLVVVVIPLGIAQLLLWVRMLEDCVAQERGKERVFWAVLILTPGFAGVVIYYFVRWRPRRRAAIGLT